MNTRTAVVVAVSALLCAVTAGAQAPGITRTVLQKGDVTTDREVIMARAEIAAGSESGRHTHFGPETGYVLEGSSEIQVDGQPTKVYKAGDSYFIPEGTIHNAKAIGGTAKVLAVYVVEKGKPLATPAK